MDGASYKVGIAYGGQVLPLGWRVVKGKKGHTDPNLQNELLAEIRPYLPPGQVVLVADSEFCAVELLAPISSWQWKFIVRVRSNVSLCPSDAPAFLLSSVALQPGQTRLWRAVQWTQKHRFGPLMVIATWRKGKKNRSMSSPISNQYRQCPGRLARLRLTLLD